MRRVALMLALLPSATLSFASGRDDEPVVLDVGEVAGLAQTSATAKGLFRYDAGLAGFLPLPFQFDERHDHLFNAGTAFEFTEPAMYDVLGEEDGILDDDDQLVFMFRDGGTQRAPAQAPWPVGAGSTRWEIQVFDPRPGVNSPPRWVYLFSGSSLPRSELRYIAWNGLPDASVTTSRYLLDYGGNWLLNGFSVLAPCGDGVDLIDRLKGRARTVGSLTEDEQNWSTNSSFIGAKVGPVRAIRYVLGATSGINTVHWDLIYDTYFARTVNLRVHPLQEVSFYFDWRLDSNLMLFTPNKRSGLNVDGINDSGVSTTWNDWALMRGPKGGMLVLFDVPASMLFQSKQFYYRDDANYDDRVPLNPNYDDEDNSAIGDNGFRLLSLGDSQTDAIVMRIRTYPLCRTEGDASVGDLYRQLADTPLDAAATRQDRGLVAVRALSVSRVETNVMLNWESQGPESTYRVYSAGTPNLPHTAWTLLAEIADTSYVDTSGTAFGFAQYYSVVAVTGGVEGPW